MRRLLGFAALAEAGLGAVLLVYPPIVLRLLLGAEVSGAGIIVSRVAGIALIGLGVACWPGNSARQQLYGMLAYSTLVTLYLVVVGLGGAAGILLWPAVAVHAVVCVLLVKTRSKEHACNINAYTDGTLGLSGRRLVNEGSVIAEVQPPEVKSGVRQAFPSTIKRWLREPLLHFLLLGVALFAIYGYLHRGRGGVESSRQIALTLDDLRTMEMYFESQWHRQPTPQEFQAMVEDKIREEVLYREGLAMGLDKDDTIVKRRMAQKMQFLAEDVSAAHEPTTAELKAWFDKNQNKFALPSRYSFRHLYFSPDKRGKNAQDDAAKALVKITGQPEDSKLAASMADQFMFQDYYGDRAPEAVAKEFGPQFAVALEKLKPGSWQGPVESGYGWHLVYVDTVIPGRIPAFEEIEPDVKTAWLGEQKTEVWRKANAEMRAKYSVYLPAPPDKQAASAPAPPPKKQVPAPSGEGPL